MAVKASAAVTLSAVVDVQSVWRYYLIQSSTLTAPLKPTAYPPPAPWGDTEPIFDSTKTETLYVVDCNVFSDGSFEYTKVSLSTAFEAAKTAFNKATGATQTAGDALNEAVQNTEAVVELSANAFTEIARTQGEIMATVAEQYYLRDETDRLVSEVSTELQQTNEEFVLRFNQFSADLDGIANGVDTEFEEIRKYIRFVDGSIVLGEAGNELELIITNEKISFLQDGAEVAYFSDRKLHVTDGEYTHSMKIGNFEFVPRENGNLSFKKP